MALAGVINSIYSGTTFATVDFTPLPTNLDYFTPFEPSHAFGTSVTKAVDGTF